MAGGGSIFLLVLLWTAVAVVTISVLHSFGDKKTYQWTVWASCFTAYFIAFTIFIMLPLDLSWTNYRVCVANGKRVCDPPLIEVDQSFLYGFWKSFYWISFNLQMFVCPILQRYSTSGHFSMRGRLREAIMDNVYFYASVGIPSFFLILYAVFRVRISPAELLNLAIPAMNSYGLILLVLLMSYGLVGIPQGLWYESSVEWKLRYLESAIPTMKETCVESEAEMYEVAALAAVASSKIGPDDPLRLSLAVILEKCPLALNERHAPPEDVNLINFNEEYLSSLNARIMRAEFVNKREQAQLQEMFLTAFFYQDIISSFQNDQKVFDSPFWNLYIPDFLQPHRQYILQGAWWWYVWVKPVSMKILAGMCAILSLMIIWSESTFQYTSLSIPSFLVNSPNSDHFTLEVLSIFFISYMCICTYSSLLRLKVLDYEMVPNHFTDQASLLFVGAYLCKLAFPLIYNYLNMAGFTNAPDSNYTNFPVFVQYFGPAVNMTPLLGERYNDLIAYLIVIVCVVFASNLHHRVSGFFGFQSVFLKSIKNNTGDAEGRQMIESARGLEIRKLSLNMDSGSNYASRTASRRGPKKTADILAKYSGRAGAEEQSAAAASSSSSNRTFGKYQSSTSGKDRYTRLEEG